MTDQEVAMDADKPDPADINAVPDPIREYIHRLETICDPAGDQRALMIAKDTIAALERQVTEAHEAKDAAERSLEEMKKASDNGKLYSRADLSAALVQMTQNWQAAESQLSALRGALEDALIVTRNYYAQAISRSELEEHQDKWKATLLLAAQGTKEHA